MGAGVNGNVASSHSKGDVSPIASDRSPTMAWAVPTEIPYHLPFRPTLSTQQSSSLPSTPYQLPRDLPFRSRSPSPHRGSISPRSAHSEFNHTLPAVRKEYGGGCKYETGMAHFRRRMPYSLGSDMLPDESGPLKESLEPEKEVRLSEDIKKLYEKLLPSTESEQRRAQFVQKLEKLLDTRWPGNEIKVKVFGSSGNKLCTSASDVDICITTPSKCFEPVCVLADFLAKSGMERVVCVSHAKVPIVKIWDPELQVACDMNVNNTLALENTRMIKTYVELDDRIRPLAMLVKHWTKRRILNDAALGGTLSSYTWICLIINFLQTRTPPIVPSLQKRVATSEGSTDGASITSTTSSTSYTSFDDDVEKFSSFGDENKSTLGELLFQFFRYYAYEVDYEKSVMSVRHAKLISKEEKGWHLLQNNRLCVEEPFNTSRNLGNTADDTSFRGLHQELRRAFKAIAEGKLDECCEQYEYPPEEERVWERPAPQPRPVLTPMPPIHSRGGRGGGRGGRNQNHYNRGSNGGRRASSAANRSNMPRQPNAAFAAEIALQAQHAQHAQYLLHDHLYQQIQILQAQEQELRMKQAIISSRGNSSMMRQQYIQIPIPPQQENGSPDENSQSRANMHNQGPLTAPVRQNVFFNPSFVAPVNVPPPQPPSNTTNPPSPSLPNATPDHRRNHRRSSVANSSPRSSLRAQSQPARPISSCVPNNFSTFYATAMGQPESPYVQNVRQPPDSPQRTPTEKDYGFPGTGSFYLKTGQVEETGVSPDYISYYVGDSPQAQGIYGRRSMASSYPGHSGLAIRSSGLCNIFYTSPEFRPCPMPTLEQSDIPLEQEENMNTNGRYYQPPQQQQQQPTRPKTLSDHGPLIIDGSLPANDYRRQSAQDDHSDQFFTPQHSSTHSQRTSRQDTPNNGSNEPSPSDQLVYEEAESVFNTPHQEVQQHHPQINGWAQNIRTSNKPAINGHIGRLETLSEQLQRFQLSEPVYPPNVDPSLLINENGINSHDHHLVNGNGNGNGNATHHAPAQPHPTTTVSSKGMPAKEPRITSPTIKRRGNGTDSEHHVNGVSQKQRPKWHSVSSIHSTSVPNIAEGRDAQKPNGVHATTKPISNGIGGGHGHSHENTTNTGGGWQTTTVKKKNKKGANKSVTGAEPLPADESLRKGG
ncbi:PAP/25A associated domain family protein [Arthroderma uncinatum]|uniref:PAP/25A associated domain family protein n=1 Tax=Arthroderma uncinatum TaxID=74035 RepID=UPI00144AA46D|nr:PAP/25A associated domain family protein [Arthroderma uncinatum]KAF3480735.1 PAP/25A associated domain family protein [Arthroderma uncinatum]